jgi:hypothetical protein
MDYKTKQMESNLTELVLRKFGRSMKATLISKLVKFSILSDGLFQKMFMPVVLCTTWREDSFTLV